MAGRVSVEDLVAEARLGLERVHVEDLEAELLAGAVVVDIRSDDQRSRDGLMPDAVRIARNVLEWRCEPDGAHADPRVSDPRQRIILVCDEGYQSSLAAATLVRLGLPGATDLVGGYRAWSRCARSCSSHRP